MDSEVICNPKKSLTHSLTHSLNNIGLRDASASKNIIGDREARAGNFENAHVYTYIIRGVFKGYIKRWHLRIISNHHKTLLLLPLS